MRRWKTAVTAVLLATVGVLGTAGCGAARDAARDGGNEAVDVVAALGAEGQALAAMGFDTNDLDVEQLAAPGESPSAGPSKGPKGERGDRWRKHRARVLLRKNMLHGEAVVQTKDGGTKTIVVQRGTVTAIDDQSMTVKSADGFTMTWRFHDDLRVVQRRTTLQADDVKVGTELGVAGAKDGDRSVARLIVIPLPK